jgi:hypothetical protein
MTVQWNRCEKRTQKISMGGFDARANRRKEGSNRERGSAGNTMGVRVCHAD